MDHVSLQLRLDHVRAGYGLLCVCCSSHEIDIHVHGLHSFVGQGPYGSHTCPPKASSQGHHVYGFLILQQLHHQHIVGDHSYIPVLQVPCQVDSRRAGIDNDCVSILNKG